ncbi:MAG: VCBS repeat-containing protein [Sandaracinus sp.]
MSALASFGKTTLVLVGLWAVLAVIGLAMGVVPLPGHDAAASAGATDGGVETPEAGIDADAGPPSDAGEAVADAGVEGTSTPPSAPTPSGPMLPRARVCAEPSLPPSLALVDAVGDARPEIVVGCGPSWELVGIGPSGALVRVAHVTAPEVSGERSALTSRAAGVDVDGDGDLDTVLPFARVGAGGATSGGGLFVLARAASGALEAPRSLAPIAAVAAAPIVLGSGPGMVALDRENPFARAPSEAWMFSLGASAGRVASPRVAVSATGLGVVDLDRDGHEDVVAAASEDSRLDVLYGDAASRFTRTRTLSIPSASEVVIGDLDGDGANDALVVGVGLSMLLAHADAELAATPIEDAPELRDAAIVNVDADPRAEIVGWSHPRLVVLDPQEDGSYEPTTLFELAGGEVGPRRHVIADVDGDGAPEVVLLVVGDEAGTRMLDLVVVPSSERGLVRTATAAPLPDAPLSLTIALPDPNAP